MVSNGVITTVAGGGAGDDGPATSAHLDFQNMPPSLAVDGSGNVYFEDFSRLTRVRKLSNGVIATVAGGGIALADNIPATQAYISPGGIAIDSAGNIYLADPCPGRIRKVSNGVIATVAGNGQLNPFVCATPVAGPATGQATAVGLDSPHAIAADSAGNVYFTEGYAGPYRARKVSNGNISTVAGGNTGLPGPPATGDNISATGATLTFFYNHSIAVDAGGILYIPDEYWVTLPPGGYYSGIQATPAFGRLRKVSNGIITTIAGSPIDGGPATDAQLNLPAGIAVDAGADLFIADGNEVIRKVSNGSIGTVAGNRLQAGGCGCDTGAASGVNLNPSGIAVDSNLNVFIASGVGLELSLASRTGPVVDQVATPGDAGGFIGVALDAAGNQYFANFMGNEIQELSNGVLTTIAGTGTPGFSGDNGLAASAQLSNPSGIAVDGAGNVYFSDVGNQRVRKISNGVITTVAGNGTAGFSGDNGPATNAELNLQASAVNCCLPVNPSPRLPGGIAVDASGNLFIADSGNQRVRMVSNGVITTVAGNGTTGFSGDNGPALSAQFNNPSGIAIDSAGKIYVSDSSNGRIRMLISNCTYNIGLLTITVPAAGGTLPITVQTSASCSWSIAGLPNWITLAAPLPGAGPATINLVVAANIGQERAAGFTIAGQLIFVTQTAAPVGCTYVVSPSVVEVPPTGGTFTLITQTQPSCSWSITGAPNWIMLPPFLPALVGSGSVVLTVVPNQNPANLAHLAVGGQTVTVIEGPASGFGPVISSVTTASGESSTIAPNTWIEIKGASLGLPEYRAWQPADLVNGQMPTSLDGVNVTMNGKSSYVSYVGPNQIDALTPPDLGPGPVQVVVNVATVTSPIFLSQAQSLSPSLFVFNGGPYAAATHADGTLLGPSGLYPGSTPAKPGETIVLFANGFGPVNPPVVKGSVSQSGILTPLPSITIGGVNAAVGFAGLVAPGEFQFNVTVPLGLGNGDQSIVATYSGQTSQSGTLITVHN